MNVRTVLIWSAALSMLVIFGFGMWFDSTVQANSNHVEPDAVNALSNALSAAALAGGGRFVLQGLFFAGESVIYPLSLENRGSLSSVHYRDYRFDELNARFLPIDCAALRISCSVAGLSCSENRIEADRNARGCRFSRCSERQCVGLSVFFDSFGFGPRGFAFVSGLQILWKRT